MGLRNTLLGALVALSMVAMATEDAQAFWGSRGSWGSYGGSWGSSGGSSGGSGGSSGGGYGGSSGSWGSNGGSYGSGGSHGGFFRRHWARRHGSSGSWGSNGGGYGSSGGSSGGSYGGQASYGYSDGGYYVSNTTEQGSAPTLVMTNPVKTTLTVRVPADAKITLAGVQTKQTGEVREFATNRLAPGQTWSNYTVRVEISRDGKTLSQDRTILLTGGQSQELDFDLGGMQVASKN